MLTSDLVAVPAHSLTWFRDARTDAAARDGVAEAERTDGKRGARIRRGSADGQ